MTNDPSRQPKGVPVGGQFATTTHAEPNLSLSHEASPIQELPADGFLGWHARCPEPRPEEWVFGEEASIDAAVGTVMDGPLSRGVINARRRTAFNTWHGCAVDKAQESKNPAYEEFASGLRTGVSALYERRMDYYELGMDLFKSNGAPVNTANHALQLAGTKRTSAEDREYWRKLLKRAPSESWHRGHLAAGLILSGADGYWGLRDDPDGAAIGPGGTGLPDDIARDESNQVFDFEVGSDSGFDTYSVDNLGGGDYRMYAEDGTGIDFEYNGDPEDHYSVQDKASAALKARGIIDDDTWIS